MRNLEAVWKLAIYCGGARIASLRHCYVPHYLGRIDPIFFRWDKERYLGPIRGQFSPMIGRDDYQRCSRIS
ncbi:MAG: hypothetical protein BECKG1743E_GA0114224_102636 [Candidatus Kentron sp. G]|nr:MAG: hypothetical protein BECKG1743E_GA0114224_102636 [Candidatus Kentron sp. G]